MISELITLGRFSRAESYEQPIHNHWLGLYVSGLEYQQTYAPDGGLAYADEQRERAFLSLSVPGMKTRFRFNRSRENWVLIFDAPAITWSARERLPVLSGVTLPWRRELNVEELAECRREFLRLHELFSSALPRDRIAARLAAGALLARLLHTPPGEHSPEERLRALIDADIRWEYTLEELSARAGLGRDRLRRRFSERYSVSPGEYRAQQRLQKAMELIIHSDLPLKEIAARLGMHHLPHLYALLKRHTDQSPAELQRRYRRTRCLQ